MGETCYSEGIAALVGATEHDISGRVDEALVAYQQAATFLLQGARRDTSATNVKKIRAKIEDILVRAKQLQEAAKARPPPAVVLASDTTAAAGGAGASSPPVGDSPSSSTVFLSTRPNVPWDAVVGLEDAKQVIQESFELPLRFPELYHGLREPWRTMLLYGPPGTGKTLLAKAMATHLDTEFINVNVANIVSKYQGDSEKNIAEIFTLARVHVAQGQSVIIFFDEIDSLGRSRDNVGSDSASTANLRIVTQLLTEFDGLSSDNRNIFIIAATNLPWIIDTGLQRRFQRRIYIGLPDAPAREAILRYSLNQNKHSLSEVDIRELATQLDNYSGSDIASVIKAAIMMPVSDIAKAVEFVRNPITNKLMPVCSETQRQELTARYQIAYLKKYGTAMEFIKQTWRDIAPHDQIDPDLPVTKDHLLQSIAQIRPVTDLDMLTKYKEWGKRKSEEEGV